MPRLNIGTSGWSYQHWKHCFYQGNARKDWLEFYAERFPAVEINASFYRLQTPKTLHNWYKQTPPNFKFAIKANRYLTHNKKLQDAQPSVLIEKNHTMALGEKLAVVLWQLPAGMKKDLSRLQHFIDALSQWPEVPHTLEFRHASWFDDETANCLMQAGIAVCQSDAATWPIWRQVSSNLVYIRLHGHTRTYASSYSTQELEQWAKRISNWLNQDKNVHVYFDNDAECAAPFNALVLLELLKSQ